MDAVAEIKARLNIEDVIGEYVVLKRSGRNFKGLSPWTNEKTPSFMVSPEKGIWHDFSSGKGGDVFSFVMELEGLDFKAALELLARKAGVELEQFRSAAGGNSQLKGRLREANALAARFYHKQLTVNRAAWDYLTKSRGFSKKTLAVWQLGYAPNAEQALSKFLTSRGFSLDEIKRAGLSAFTRTNFSGKSLGGQGGTARDFFRGRMMIPLASAQGEVIGFTARLLADNPEAPKYINTPATLIYDKSRHVFGLHLAKEAIRKTGLVVVAEGNMDVIASHQAGVANVVASAGTAMTEQHLRELKRFTGDIRLSFDADAAGVAATERIIPLAQKVGVQLKIIDTGAAKDPDELIKQDVKKWQAAIDKAVYATDWLIERYKEQLDLSSASGKRQFTDTLLATIRRLADPVEQEHYLKLIAELTDSSLEAIKAKLLRQPALERPPARKIAKSPPAVVERAAAEYQKLQDHLLAMALASPAIRPLLNDLQPEYFTESPSRQLFEFLKNNPESRDLKGLTRLDEAQGADEQRTKAVQDGTAKEQRSRQRRDSPKTPAVQPAPPAGRPGWRVSPDYVKILSLQFEELYADLDPDDLAEQATSLRTRLLSKYLNLQKQKLALAMTETDDSQQIAKLLKQADDLNKLFKTTKQEVSK